jgi:hypothetical protein
MFLLWRIPWSDAGEWVLYGSIKRLERDTRHWLAERDASKDYLLIAELRPFNDEHPQ